MLGLVLLVGTLTDVFGTVIMSTVVATTDSFSSQVCTSFMTSKILNIFCVIGDCLSSMQYSLRVCLKEESKRDICMSLYARDDLKNWS